MLNIVLYVRCISLTYVSVNIFVVRLYWSFCKYFICSLNDTCVGLCTRYVRFQRSCDYTSHIQRRINTKVFHSQLHDFHPVIYQLCTVTNLVYCMFRQHLLRFRIHSISSFCTTRKYHLCLSNWRNYTIINVHFYCSRHIMCLRTAVIRDFFILHLPLISKI